MSREMLVSRKRFSLRRAAPFIYTSPAQVANRAVQFYGLEFELYAFEFYLTDIKDLY